MSAVTLQCIYASTSGNVEAVVEAVTNVWRERGWSVELHRAEKTSFEVIEQHSHFLLATSTWEHGALNPFFAKLFKELTTHDVQGKQAAFIGLGDRRYEPVLFCEGMEILKRAWEKNHGQVIGMPLKMNGEPYAQIPKVAVPWAEQLMSEWHLDTKRPSAVSGVGSQGASASSDQQGFRGLINRVFNHA